MITHDDVRLAMTAADPLSTSSQVDSFHSEISEALEARTDQLTEQLRSQWVSNHDGRQPDGLTWGQIIESAQQIAEQQIRQEYLAELTEQVVQAQIDDPDDSPHLRALRSKDGWKLNPEDIQTSARTQTVLEELWLEKPVEWTIVAGALIERLEFLDKPYPADWDSRLIPIFEKMVDQALAERQTPPSATS